jgi:hypothetical protein
MYCVYDNKQWGRAPTEGADQYRKGPQGIVQNGLEEVFSGGEKVLGILLFLICIS